ncbi:hypothetical protein DSO57_1026439, partial [Entomophthora muscae]
MSFLPKELSHLVFQEIKACAFNFALKANPRLASNLKSFVIKISRRVLLDVVPRSQTQHLLASQASCFNRGFKEDAVNQRGAYK